MKKGSDKGKQTCLGAKIDMKSNNGALRDPAIYHLKLSHIHAMVQNITSIPPTISRPIVDSVEGFTHALRTTEYMGRPIFLVH